MERSTDVHQVEAVSHLRGNLSS